MSVKNPSNPIREFVGVSHAFWDGLEGRQRVVGPPRAVAVGTRLQQLKHSRGELRCRFSVVDEDVVVVAGVDALFKRAGVFAVNRHTKAHAGAADLFGGVFHVI